MLSDLDIYNLPLCQIKQFTPDSWSQVSAESHQVKVASCGIVGKDAQDALNYMSPELMHALKHASLDPDCYYVHHVAMGGSRRYGPNRWGDGFREEVLARDVGTFETAKAYRRHKSNAGDPFFGQVKVANFRSSDGVIELVTEYFGTPRVAAKHGGLVADKELDILLKHGSLPVSMGSWVPGDVCVICGQFARKKSERCSSKQEGGNCRLFGCKTGLLKLSSLGELQYVDNPRNRFYDISWVKVGADPIAYGGILPIGDYYDSLSEMRAKTASLLDSDSIVRPDDERLDVFVGAIHNLSNYEQKTAAYLADSDYDMAVGSHFYPEASDHTYASLASNSPATVASGLRDIIAGGNILSYSRFAKAAGCGSASDGFLPDLFTRIRANSLVSKVASLAYNFEKFLPSNLIKVASIGNSRLDLSSRSSGSPDSNEVIRTSLQYLGRGYRATPVTPRGVADTIPEVVLKFASLAAVVDANLGNDVVRFLTITKNSTRLNS